MSPANCALAFAAAPGRICLVTDAAACAGMPPGQYLLGGEPITLPPGDGVPPRRADGGLAGSALRMDSAVANMVAVGAGLPDAVSAATRIPADLIGGRISAGSRRAPRPTWPGSMTTCGQSRPGSAASGCTREQSGACR